MKPSPPSYPRALAIRILTRVLSEREALDTVLEKIFSEERLEVSARAWLQELCSGTLRWKGRLDFILDSTALKKKPTGWLRKLLLTSAYQLVVQERTSPGAVVSESVDEVKRKEGEAPARFANACLRKVSEHADRWRVIPVQDAASASLPEWWWRKLVSQRGLAWTQAYAQASLERPLLWIRARRAEWKPDWAVSGPVSLSWLDEKGGMVTEKSGFKEGEFIVQDISSQALITEIAQTVLREFPAPSALDLCAAPGGKSIGLAWMGFQVHATDISDSRLKLLSQSLERIQGHERIEIVSREQGPQDKLQDGTYELVWVDAPCTGSGIIRRHPDVRWLRQESDLPELVKTQAGLLAQAWPKVKPGGFLAYSVCSVFMEEGERVFRAFCQAQGVLPAREWLLEPQLSPLGDGFWAGLLRKRL